VVTALALVIMDRVLESLDHSIELGRKHISEQERRVERQRELIAGLKSSGHHEAAENSKTLLAAMENLLSQMRQDLADAEHRWAERIGRNDPRPVGGDGGRR
jgi:hypothetical protein